MQIVPKETICMKYQKSILGGNIISLQSAEFAQREVKINHSVITANPLEWAV